MIGNLGKILNHTLQQIHTDTHTPGGIGKELSIF